MTTSHLPSALTPEMIRRYDRPGPRYTSYPTAVEFSPTFDAAEFAHALARADALAPEPISLYLHLPYCQSLCTYCGCNVVIRRDPSAADEYLDALEQEIALATSFLPRRRRVESIHFGGGTPNFLTVPQLERVFTALRNAFDVLPTAEIAMEIDPRTAEAEKLHRLVDLGLNRASVGVQDTNPDVQRAVNRIQPLEMTAATLSVLRSRGVASLNVDLIYGLPLQTLAGFRRTLGDVLSLRPDRVAIYNFAFVPWLKPQQKKIDPSTLPNPETRVSLYLEALETMAAAGYVHIGMDHFARPEDELALALAAGRLTRNFQGYALTPPDTLLGLGVTSISEIGGAYSQNRKKIKDYRDAVSAGCLPVERGITLTADDTMRRELIRHVMCRLNVDLAEIAARHGVDAGTAFREELAALEPLSDDGLVEIDGLTLRVTPLGRILIRNVASVFDAYRRNPAPATVPVFSRTV